MRVRFWGVRGSIPTPATGEDVSSRLVEVLLHLGQSPTSLDLTSREAVTQWVSELSPAQVSLTGGNTPCIEMTTDSGELFIIDFGSGLRGLGNEMMEGAFGQGIGHAHLFLSHFHWDHIQGWPFFRPAYVKGNRFDLYARHQNVERRLQQQQEAPFFPPDAWNQMEADVNYHHISEFELLLCDGAVRVTNLELAHPSRAFAYRFEADGAVFIYASDGAFPAPKEEEAERYIKFFEGADLIVFDAQFSLLESLEKEAWGHSSGITGAALACRANAKRLALFHHDPNASEANLETLLKSSQQYAAKPALPCLPGAVEIILAREGLEIQL